MSGRFTGFVNQTEMASFSSFIGEIRWSFVVFVLTLVDAWLLTRDSETMRATGIAVLGVIGTTLLGKTVAGVVTSKNVRDSSREALAGKAKIAEAEARGKAESSNNHPAVHAEKIEKVEVQEGPRA